MLDDNTNPLEKLLLYKKIKKEVDVSVGSISSKRSKETANM
jgi:hypothetical protein